MEKPAVQLRYGVGYHWIEDGRVVVITTEGDMSREAVDVWAETAIELAKTWSSTEPICIIHDFTHPKLGITLYSRKRSIDILKAIPPNRTIYTVSLLANNWLNQVLRVFIQLNLSSEPNHKVKAVLSVEEGLEWLKAEARYHLAQV